MKKMYQLFVVCSLIIFAIGNLCAQPSTFIDDHGVMRWAGSNDEVCAFGTNYSVPFSYWKEREPIGADYKKAIDEDVYHIARLGLDGYRIHVWDAYISDSVGNLVYNEHFQLYDYLQYKLKERGIKMFITPMNFFEDTNYGFTTHFGGKTGCLSDTAAFTAQENYLIQFLNHVNPYTGIAYKNDPDIIAFAIGNEPAHWKAPKLETPYINRMYDAMRSTGCEKPIFYNMTTCAEFIDDVLASKIQGGTFQWYPTGLTSNHDLKGNMLPNVDQYIIPFDDRLKQSNRPKVVYEFCPSDLSASASVYPAMARSFREAGFQFAAQFAYDPMHEAFCNVEYRTHYLNFAYTPKESIGLMIASEVFHAVSLNKSYGRYPRNNKFESFTLDSENDLAEMITDNKYIYTTTTQTIPPKPNALEKVAGTGNSAIVKYDGTGLYILDKLETGVWRLEVMPDVVWVRDPFFVPDVKKEVAVTLWKNHRMNIQLPDLGSDFGIVGLNDGNNLTLNSTQSSFAISPGTYLLTRKGKKSHWAGTDKWKNIQLNEFHAPTRKLDKTYLLHTPPSEVCVGQPIKLTAKIVAPFEPEHVEVIVLGTGRGKVLPMKKINSYDYEVEIPTNFTVSSRYLRYNISIKRGDDYLTYPSGEEGSYLLDRRIYGDDQLLDVGVPYQIPVLPASAPICLFNANRDWSNLTKMKRNDDIDCFPSDIFGLGMVHLKIANLMKDEHNFCVGSYCRETIERRKSDLSGKRNLVVYGRSLCTKPCILQLSMVMKDGSAYGGLITLDKETDFYKLPISALKKVKSVLLPRPYPKFNAYWFEPSVPSVFDLSNVESIQISLGPGMSENEYKEKHEVAIGEVTLE